MGRIPLHVEDSASMLQDDAKQCACVSKQSSLDDLTSRSVDAPCPLCPTHLTPARRPTPYYAREYLDSDPEVGHEAKLPSMVLLRKDGPTEKLHLHGSTAAVQEHPSKWQVIARDPIAVA